MVSQLHTPEQAADWLRARVTGVLRTDSRQLQAGDGFVAWPGLQHDARRFVAQARAAGAAACLVEHQGWVDSIWADGLRGADDVASYAGLKPACGSIASVFYGQPSQALQLVAVTGTNGKTSISWWLAAALNRLGLAGLAPCAVAGTLGLGVPPALNDQGLTTAGPELLQRRLRGFVDEGVAAAVLEASSIGLAEHRLAGTALRVAVFSNFSQDHLDYHHSMEAYWQAKQALFDWPGLEAAVINMEDERGFALAERVRRRGLDVWTVSMGRPARLAARHTRPSARGMCFQIVENGLESQSCLLDAPVLGRHNVANLLAVLACMRALGVPLEQAVAACGDLPPVPGRMERIEMPGAPLAVVDYAHTPEALVQALAAVYPLAALREGRLWCVFGCGGGRDAGKRPLMAAAAARKADRLVLTSDNPRHEDPLAIIEAMRAGLDGVPPDRIAVQPDRGRAIAQALARAAPEDVVLIAGKGHEQTQEVAGRLLPFSDIQQARQALRVRLAAQGVKA